MQLGEFDRACEQLTRLATLATAWLEANTDCTFFRHTFVRTEVLICVATASVAESLRAMVSGCLFRARVEMVFVLLLRV